MLSDPDNEGVGFGKRGDSLTVLVISLAEFALSVIFAAIWIGMPVGIYGVDAQVTVQPAFTVATFIMATGTLLIALFAFLNIQTGLERRGGGRNER